MTIIWSVAIITLWLLSGIIFWVLMIFKARALTTNDLLFLIPCAFMGPITVLIYIFTFIILRDRTLWKW